MQDTIRRIATSTPLRCLHSMKRWISITLLCVLLPFSSASAEPETAPQAVVAVSPAVSAVTLAAARWDSSCKRAGPLGCLTLRRVARKNSCQPFVDTLQFAGRKRSKAKQAAAQLAEALEDLGTAPAEAEDDAVAAARAQALFLQGEASLEAFAQLKVPSGLTFSEKNRKRKKKSEERFVEYMRQANTLVDNTSAMYQRVIALPEQAANTRWRAAAVARISRVHWIFASQLYGIQIPPDIRTGPYAEDAVAAFCDALANVADRLAARARKGAQYCVDEIAESSAPVWHSECKSMLGPSGQP